MACFNLWVPSSNFPFQLGNDCRMWRFLPLWVGSGRLKERKRAHLRLEPLSINKSEKGKVSKVPFQMSKAESCTQKTTNRKGHGLVLEKADGGKNDTESIYGLDIVMSTKGSYSNSHPPTQAASCTRAGPGSRASQRCRRSWAKGSKPTC